MIWFSICLFKSTYFIALFMLLGISFINDKEMTPHVSSVHFFPLFLLFWVVPTRSWFWRHQVLFYYCLSQHFSAIILHMPNITFVTSVLYKISVCVSSWFICTVSWWSQRKLKVIPDCVTCTETEQCYVMDTVKLNSCDALMRP